VLTRRDAPRLYGLCDRVAAELKAEPIDLIVVNGDFNAGYGTVGLRRTKVIFLGLPLWNALSAQQRVAVIGHELAHQVNGDSRHGLIVGTSLGSMSEIHSLLRPGHGIQAGSNLYVRVGDLLARFITWILRGIVGLVIRAQQAMMMRAGQRAEYLADDLSARIASSDATAEVFDQLLTVQETTRQAVRTHALSPRTFELWKGQRELISKLPELERVRVRRVAAKESLRVDTSHPPTHLRIAFVKGRASHEARIRAEAEEEKAIELELALSYSRIGAELADDYLGSLYR
jgi:Zn-dependent protease with chaperone function